MIAGCQAGVGCKDGGWFGRQTGPDRATSPKAEDDHKQDIKLEVDVKPTRAKLGRLGGLGLDHLGEKKVA